MLLRLAQAAAVFVALSALVGCARSGSTDTSQEDSSPSPVVLSESAVAVRVVESQQLPEVTPLVEKKEVAEQQQPRLGDQPGLGSDDFVLSDLTFVFPPGLHVEYRRSQATMASGNKYGETTAWRPVTNPVHYAYDVNIMEKMGMPLTAVQVNGEWFMPFGDTIIGDNSTVQHTVWSVCMTEQACADFRVRKRKGSSVQLKTAVKSMIAVTSEVNRIELCDKRHKCQ